MALEGDIQAALGALVSGRCYPLVNTNTAIVSPYITYQVISSSPNNISIEEDRVRVQIDLLAKTYGEVKALRNSAKAAMNAFKNSARIMDFDGYEPASKEFRATLEYYIWQ